MLHGTDQHRHYIIYPAAHGLAQPLHHCYVANVAGPSPTTTALTTLPVMAQHCSDSTDDADHGSALTLQHPPRGAPLSQHGADTVCHGAATQQRRGSAHELQHGSCRPWRMHRHGSAYAASHGAISPLQHSRCRSWHQCDKAALTGPAMAHHCLAKHRQRPPPSQVDAVAARHGSAPQLLR